MVPRRIKAAVHCNQILPVPLYLQYTLHINRRLMNSFGYCHHFYVGKKWSINKRRSLFCNCIDIDSIFFNIFLSSGGPQGTYVYSSFRNRNFWLEYSTPPTTLFPEYDEYNPEPSATPEPGPIFRDASLNHSTIQSPVGSTVFLDCRIADLMDYQVKPSISTYTRCNPP